MSLRGRRSSIPGFTCTSNQQIKNRHASEVFSGGCPTSIGSAPLLRVPGNSAESHSNSINSRTSISVSWSGATGDRFAHSIASSSDFAWIIQYPATSSFDSVNGPSITVFFPPVANLTRAPLELGYRPAASTRIPALACSWLYFTIAVIDSSLGILPASESLFDFRINMNFIVLLLSRFQIEFNSWPHFYVEPQTPKSTSTGEFAHEIRLAP